jgi:hypothetical protein
MSSHRFAAVDASMKFEAPGIALQHAPRSDTLKRASYEKVECSGL